MRKRYSFLAAAVAAPLFLGNGASGPVSAAVAGTMLGDATAPTDLVRRVVLDPALRPSRSGDVVSTHAAFPLTVDGRAVSLGLQTVTLLPGGTLRVDTPVSGADLLYQDGSTQVAGPTGWEWTAPTVPGAYALKVRSGDEAVHITALVMHPATSVENERLNGYRIGTYLAEPLRGDPAYLPPTGFVEVSGDLADLLISPRLRLGQFLCKQPGDPRYVVVSAPLVEKLEAVADRLEAQQVSPSALTVMSGFRTPAYNRAIGNTTSYSRHLWGDAADIYIDADGDGDMDDLDGNGRSDTGDAHVLAGWIEEVVEHEDVKPGGLSVYRRNAAHGPFVHVDARGTKARW